MTVSYSTTQIMSVASSPAATVIAGSAITTTARPTLVVPESQLYYWTGAWQRNERIAVEELARGEGERFETPGDAIRWLLSSED